MLTQRRPEVAVPLKNYSNRYAFATGMILLLGIGLRLFHYANNRSLWTDEIYLNAGIVDFSFAQLLSQPLPYLQKAPVGYLLLSHLCVVLLGKTELALRLYPLLSGIGALFLLRPVARHFLKPFGALVALALLALGTPLLYHAVEAKPYGPDLCVTLALLWLYIRYGARSDWPALLRWGLGGSLAVWLSYPSIFVLAGLALAAGLPPLLHGNWARVGRVALPASLWLLSFALSYFLFTKEGSDAGWLVFFFYKFDAYFPLQPVSAGPWLLKKLAIFFHYPLGLTWYEDQAERSNLARFVLRLTLVPVLLSGLGVLYFWRTHKAYLGVTGSVLLLALLASSLRLYPFHERMIVYLAPFAILLLAGGCDYLRTRAARPLRYAGYGLTLLLLLGLAKNALVTARTPYLLPGYKMSYYRPALQYVAQHARPGDGVYVYWNAAAGYTYYTRTLGLPLRAVVDPDYRYTVDTYAAYYAKVDADLRSAAKARRVWVLYSGVDMNQGDYGGQPAWYYQGHDFREGYGVQQYARHLQQLGRVLERYVPADGNPNPDVKVQLLELNN